MPPSDALSAVPPPAERSKVRRRSDTVTCFRFRGAEVVPRDDDVAAEIPVALAYNGVSHVVMMATPADLADFALGFSLSEGILAHADELLDISFEEGENGIQAKMAVTSDRFAALGARQRNLTGRTGCGLCGVDNLTQVARPVPRVGSGLQVSVAAIHKALDALPERQSINKRTGAVHAAAWADPEGNLLLVREDVGRHNALDKLIGAMARAQIDPESGFAVITSRCSFEMVQKAATVGMTILVAISAPTTLALQIAERTGLTLVALARADSINLYANPGRLLGLAGARTL